MGQHRGWVRELWLTGLRLGRAIDAVLSTSTQPLPLFHAPDSHAMLQYALLPPAFLALRRMQSVLAASSDCSALTDCDELVWAACVVAKPSRTSMVALSKRGRDKSNAVCEMRALLIMLHRSPMHFYFSEHNDRIHRGRPIDKTARDIKSITFDCIKSMLQLQGARVRCPEIHHEAVKEVRAHPRAPPSRVRGNGRPSR